MHCISQDQKNIDLLNKLDYSEIANLVQTNQNFNRALGSIYGAFIGDALGSTWEFRNPKLLKKETVSEMNGGGVFLLSPGQLTDDSQLALQLGYALQQFNGIVNSQNVQILSKKIALNYVEWLQSAPFDIGQTCSSAFQAISSINQEISPKIFLQEVRNKLRDINLQSQSNGSLMRIIPLAIFFAFFEEQSNSQQCEKLLENEIRFTHNNEIAIGASKLWLRLIKLLINRNHISTDKIYKDFSKMVENYPIKELQNWFKGQIPHAQQNIGWAKIAWTEGIKHLNRSTKNPDLNFEQIMIQVLLKGGDTDTNACIVGGLVGSIIGFKKLPLKFLQKSLKLKFDYNDKSKKNNRQEKYLPRNGLNIVYKLFQTSKKIKKI